MKFKITTTDKDFYIEVDKIEFDRKKKEALTFKDGIVMATMNGLSIEPKPLIYTDVEKVELL